MTDKLREAAQQAPMAYYALVIKADSGYESTTEGRCTADQYGAAMAALHGTAALAQQDAQAELPIIRQNKLLADALASCILASGIVRTDIDGLTGPQLLLFAEDLREMLEAKTAQQDAQAVPTQRQYELALGQWDQWKSYALELQAKLVKYEGGSPMVLNAAPTPPAQAATCKQDLQVDVLLDEMLEAAPAVAQVPQGWKLVPVAPTPEMRKAAADAWIDCGDRLILNKAAAAVRAGIAAAPTPPAQQDAQAINHIPDAREMVSPTYGSEEIRKLRETIQSMARIIRDYEAAPTPPAPKPLGWLDRKAVECLQGAELNWMPAWNRPTSADPVPVFLGPPAQRVMLTDEDIREWWVSENGLEDCDMTKLDDFTKVVRAVIEAYERKNAQPKTLPAPLEQQGNPYPST